MFIIDRKIETKSTSGLLNLTKGLGVRQRHGENSGTEDEVAEDDDLG